MTFIKLDPNLMQGLIKNLESYADEAERARSDIHSSSVNNSHPVPEVDDATYLPAIFTVTSADAPTSRMMDTLNSMSINSNTGSSYNTTMGATINALGEVIDGLQERLQVIIDLNTDGISTTSSDGVPGYYLPDGTADTVENVKSYNTEAVATARADADALTQATASSNGTAEDGRTVDEILDSLTINQDNPVYGAAVVTEVGGAQAYLDLLYSVNDYYENDYKGECPEDHFQVASQVLGYVLAAASQWEGETLADDLYETIDSQNGAPGNMAAINMLLSAPAAHYGTDFLTNLADKLEDRDPDALVPAYQVFANNKTSTSDPMDGVLTAMGNNPDAALEYLTPEGDGSVDEDGVWVPGQTTVDRWTMLTSRDWGEDASGLDALTAVMGAASSFRNRAPSESDPDVPATADARATYACGRAMSYFGGEGFTKKDFTDTMKRNLAVVVANSSEDVSTAAINGALGTGATSSGLAATDISSLIYRFGDHQDAMTTLATGLGQYHHNKLKEAMNDPDANENDLGDGYQQVAASSSYLQTLSEFRFADDKKKDSEEQTTTVDTSLSVLNAVSTAGLTALTDEAAAFTTGSTIAKPLVSSQVTDALGTSTGDPYTDLKAQSYAAGLNYGLFSTDSDKGGQRAIDTARSHSWYHEDENGNPAIDTTALTGDQASDAMTWRKNQVTNSDDKGVLNDLEESITTGKTDGEKSAKSNNGPRRT
nr:DUF6571 family protein [uncultured Actinomyces sp.]